METRIGMLQQHNVADSKENIRRLSAGIEDLAKRGAQLIKMLIILILPSQYQALQHVFMANWQSVLA